MSAYTHDEWELLALPEAAVVSTAWAHGQVCLTGCLPHCATHRQARVIEAVCMVSQCTAKQARASCYGGPLTDSLVAWHQLTCRPSDYLAALYPVLKAESALVRVWRCWILARHLVCPATAAVLLVWHACSCQHFATC